MRSALAAAALVVVANAFVVVSANHERAAPATFTTIEVCANHLEGGEGSDNAPALRLRFMRDPESIPHGLDSAGLLALGFAQADIAKLRQPKADSARWTRERPAWVRLRQRPDSLRLFEPVEVASRLDQLPPDSTSLIIRGLIAIRWLRIGPPNPPSSSDPQPADTLHPVVDDLIPSVLHLDRHQIDTLRAALPDSAGCAMPRRVRVAQGSNGGLWVLDIP